MPKPKNPRKRPRQNKKDPPSDSDSDSEYVPSDDEQDPPKKRKIVKRPKKNSDDDVDEYGNIKDLIDYSEGGVDEGGVDEGEEDTGGDVADDEMGDVSKTEKEMVSLFFKSLVTQIKNKQETPLEKIIRLFSESKVPEPMKGELLEKLKAYVTYGELPEKLNEWYNSVLRIPFGKYSLPPVVLYDNVIPEPQKLISQILTTHRKINDDVVMKDASASSPSPSSSGASEDVKKYFLDAVDSLNDAVYGLNNVKEEILNYIAQIISSKSAHPRIIALQGHPGIGKTQIVRNGIAKCLQRPMATISMGGAKDSSFLLGHDFTYVGARYGKLAQCLMETGVMNPVIFIDELDKISGGFDGPEIEGTLIHITDPVQNNDFRDKYFTELPIDLSQVLFIVAVNDISRVNPILRDRLHIIKVDGPSHSDKIVIARKYLIKEVMRQYNYMSIDDFTFTDDVLGYIINNYAKTEMGVRKLKSCMETIIGRLNTLKLLGSSISDIKNKINLSFGITVTFPVVITRSMVDVFLKDKDDDLVMLSHPSMYL